MTASGSAALRAMAALGAGDDEAFDRQERAWREVLERHGLSWLGAAQGLVMAALETWTGRAEVAEQRLLEAREVLSAAGDVWWLVTIDPQLCRALAAQDRPREFLTHADAFEASGPVPDRETLVRRPLLRSQVLLMRGCDGRRRGRSSKGDRRGRRIGSHPCVAEADLVLADVLEARGRASEAAASRGSALDLLRAKRFKAALDHLGRIGGE